MLLDCKVLYSSARGVAHADRACFGLGISLDTSWGEDEDGIPQELRVLLPNLSIQSIIFCGGF